MSDLPIAEVRSEVAGLARSMAALMADPQTRSADSRPVTMGRRMAVVTAVNPGPPLTADVELNSTIIPGVSPQSTYRPQVNDIVWLEFLGADAHISPPLTTEANRKWNLLSVGGGWGAVAGYLAPAYWRDPLGMVHLVGTVGGGATGSTIATLPSGFRPPGSGLFAAGCISGGVAWPATIVVNNAGAIVYDGTAAPTRVGLDTVHFRVD
jgi:hypothetical protein